MRLGVALIVLLSASACDLGRLTVGTTAKVLVRAQPALAQESDYQLAHDAIPATLKTIEGFWIVDPDNTNLLGLLTEGYCQYGSAFIEDDWEIAKFAKRIDEVQEHNARATHIFTRCLNYALKQLGAEWQDQLFGSLDQVRQLAAKTGGDHRDQMMWTAVALGSIVNHNLSRAELLTYIGAVRAILDRVLELDRTSPPARLDYAALPHIAYGMLQTAVSAQFGGEPAKAKSHFEAALAVTGGKFLLARALMAYRVGVITNDRAFFHAQLKLVVETPPSIWPEQRLANEVAHRRARRYLTHEKELFP